MVIKKSNEIKSHTIVVTFCDENIPRVLFGNFVYNCETRKVIESGKLFGWGYYNFKKKQLELLKQKVIVEKHRSKRSRPHRHKAHMVFDLLYSQNVRYKMTGTNNRFAAKAICYEWLAIKMKMKRDEAHIGYFNKDQCKKVIELSKNKLEELGVDVPHHINNLQIDN